MKIPVTLNIAVLLLAACGSPEGSSPDGGSPDGGALVVGFHASGRGDAPVGFTLLQLNTTASSFTCNQEEDGVYIAFFVNGDMPGEYSHYSGSMDTIPAGHFQAVLQDISGGQHLNKRASTSGFLRFNGPADAPSLTGEFDLTFPNDELEAAAFSTTGCDINV